MGAKEGAVNACPLWSFLGDWMLGKCLVGLKSLLSIVMAVSDIILIFLLLSGWHFISEELSVLF